MFRDVGAGSSQGHAVSSLAEIRGDITSQHDLQYGGTTVLPIPSFFTAEGNILARKQEKHNEW